MFDAIGWLVFYLYLMKKKKTIMRKISGVILGCLLLVCCHAQSIAQHQLKVMTYNIHHANPPAKPDYIDIPAIAKVVNDSGAELVALQELDIKNHRSGIDLDQAAELGKLTGMYHFFAKGIDFLDGQYGVAILSKYPILKSKRHALPMIEGSGGEPRALAVVTVKHPKGKKFTFACTHMDLIEDNRLLQAAFIVEKLAKAKRNPVILAGDFNAEPDSKVMDIFFDVFKNAIYDGPTYPQVNPQQQLDYVLFRFADGLTPQHPKIIKEEYASDHLPLYVEFTW